MQRPRFVTPPFVAICTLFAIACGRPPKAPEPVDEENPTGTIAISVIDQGRSAVGLHVFLDGVATTCDGSPCRLENVSTGPHEVHIDGPTGMIAVQWVIVEPHGEVRMTSTIKAAAEANPVEAGFTGQPLPSDGSCSSLERRRDRVCQIDPNSVSCRSYRSKYSKMCDRGGS